MASFEASIDGLPISMAQTEREKYIATGQTNSGLATKLASLYNSAGRCEAKPHGTSFLDQKSTVLACRIP
jgi:hypothetical protein